MQKLKKYQQYLKPPQNQYDAGAGIGVFKPPFVHGRVDVQSPSVAGGGNIGGYGSSPTTPSANTDESGSSFLDAIYSSPNPELALQKYMFEIGMLNIFELYQKNIAGLDEARQKDIADAYYIRELSKKYLGEYASNIGVGDVSGELIDIYANYAQNLAYISQNYEALQAGYEEKMMEKEMEYAQGLLGLEIGIKDAEYNQTLLEANNDISLALQTGDYGDYDNFNDWLNDYVNQLDLPTKYKEDIKEYYKEAQETFEKSTFVAIKGAEFINSTMLERFGVTEQPNIDPTYYTDKDIMPDYAFMQDGHVWGVATEATDLPKTATEGFSWRKDGQGFVTYQGDIYLYMPDGTFHKMVRLEFEGNQFSNLTNGAVVENSIIADLKDINNKNFTVSVNGATYKIGTKYFWGSRVGEDDSKNKKLPEGMLEAFGFTADKQDGRTRIRPNDGDFNKYKYGKVLFYNGRYYLVYFDDRINDKKDGLRIVELDKA